METTHEETDNIQKLAEMIRDIKFAMVTSQNEDGLLSSRPMTTQNAPFDGVLWFLVSKSCQMSQEVLRNPRVNLAYTSGLHQRYISVSGTAEILKDPQKERELWNPLYKAWFPEGLNDPDLALMRVEAQQAEYWDAVGGKVAGVIRFVKALTMGKKYQNLTGEHRHLSMRH
jgi:general stress protein 26